MRDSLQRPLTDLKPLQGKKEVIDPEEETKPRIVIKLDPHIASNV